MSAVSPYVVKVRLWLKLLRISILLSLSYKHAFCVDMPLKLLHETMQRFLDTYLRLVHTENLFLKLKI